MTEKKNPLLRFFGTWKGDDFEDCLEMVNAHKRSAKEESIKARAYYDICMLYATRQSPSTAENYEIFLRLLGEVFDRTNVQLDLLRENKGAGE